MDAFRINIRDLHIAFLEKDDETGATYTDPELIAGTTQIQLAPKVASAVLYGDGKPRDKTDKVSGYDVTLDHNKIPPHMLARIKGQKTYAKMRRSNANDQGVYFALSWGVDLTGGHKEMTWLTKCKLAPSNKNVQQQTDNVNYGTDTFSITAIPLEYNGDFEYIADTSDDELGFTLDDAELWFEEVPVAPPEADAEPTP